MTLPEDTEILDGIAKAIFESENPDVEWTAPYTRKTARAVMAELRRRGAFLPGDPITDEMVAAASHAFITAGGPHTFLSMDMRAAITEALAARKP